MKIAYLFAGQGAQYPGMGRDLYDNYEASRRILDEAGEKVKALCFEGTAEELKETQNTQPCVYAVTMAAYAAFAEKGLSLPPPAAYAGFSLGEYAALTAAGVITDIAAGAELMQKRGLWMAEAGMSADGGAKGSMAAAIGDVKKVLECVEAARQDDILIAANFNAPTQTVVSGDKAAIERFIEKAKEYRLRVTPLAVSSAFHSPMMEPASEKMRELIENKAASFNCDAASKVYSNLTAGPISEYRYDGGSGNKADIPDAAAAQPFEQSAAASDFAGLTITDLADAMARQLMSPVRWVEIIQRLIADGVDTFIEFGPGRTLSGLVKKIDKNVKTFSIGDSESLENAVKELGIC